MLVDSRMVLDSFSVVLQQGSALMPATSMLDSISQDLSHASTARAEAYAKNNNEERQFSPFCKPLPGDQVVFPEYIHARGFLARSKRSAGSR